MSADQQPGQPKERSSFSVTKGSAVVRVFYTPSNRVWTVAWYNPDGTRGRRSFRDEAMARESATCKAAELSGQRSHALTLTPSEAADYQAARSKLPPSIKLVTAVDYYLARVPQGADRKRVGDVADELREELKSLGLSPAYLRSSGNALKKISEGLDVPLADVTPSVFREWLRSLDLQPKTIKGLRGIAVRLFNFAAERGLLTRESVLELAAVRTAKVVVADARTLSPEHLRAMLTTASDGERAALVFLAFCPLRTAEVARLDWRDVRMAERVVIANAASSKLSVRRVAPIAPAGLEWLQGLTHKEGPVSPTHPDPEGNKLAHRLPVIAQAAGAAYAKNCLRHSCISALMAIHEDAARVSLWAGNSPRMVASVYSSRWTRSQGEAWMAVRPEQPANVTTLPASEVAA